MRAAKEGMRQWGMQCDQTGRCQEWELGEQEKLVGKGQLEVVTVERAGPGFPGLAGSCHAQHNSLGGDDHLVDHHPVVVRRVACLVHA